MQVTKRSRVQLHAISASHFPSTSLQNRPYPVSLRPPPTVGKAPAFVQSRQSLGSSSSPRQHDAWPFGTLVTDLGPAGAPIPSLISMDQVRNRGNGEGGYLRVIQASGIHESIEGAQSPNIMRMPENICSSVLHSEDSRYEPRLVELGRPVFRLVGRRQ